MGRGLGKGIDSLLPSSVDINRVFGAVDINEIDIDSITPNEEQPRRKIQVDELAELTHSIKTHGVLQPILLVPASQGKYTIVAGERRWRAAKQSGLKKIPAIVKKLDDMQQLEVAIIENVQRQDLSALEQAESIRRLHDDFGQTYEDIAKKLGKAYASVANTVRLLKLPASVQVSLNDGVISEGHARSILSLDANKQEQSRLHTLIIQNAWSVRRAEQYVKEIKSQPKTVQTKQRNTNYIENAWTKNVSKRLGARVVINPMAKGGYIKISYSNDDDLEKITKSLS